MTTPQHIILKLSHDEAALVVACLRAMPLPEEGGDRLTALSVAGVLEGELEARA